MNIPRTDEHVEAVEIAGELRVKVSAVAQKVLGLFRDETSGPKQALVVLHFVTEYLKETAGVKAIETVVVGAGGEN